ncbi:18374_t:CDS:2, partial [Racocetra fulgida]
MSQNLRKEAATRASRRASSNAGPPLAFNFTGGTPLSSRHNTDEEDMWSETSADTVDSWTSTGSKNAEDGILEEVNWEDEVLQTIEDLGEKRTSTRRDTLLDLLCRSIRKDKSYKESRLAAKELLDFFNEIILTNGKSVNANNEGGVIESALNAYGLLFSGLWGDSKRGSDKAREEFERIMPSLIKQLESSTMEVRVASGEIIALMFESLGIGKESGTVENWGQSQDDYDEDEVDYDDMEHLTQLLNALATDSNRHRAKAEHRVQERLKIKKQTIYFSSWAKILQLNAFREILSEGLHVHFQENELLQAIFEFVPPPTLVSNRLRPDSALSFHTTGSDTD